MRNEKILMGVVVFLLLGFAFLLVLYSTNDLVCAMSFVVSIILGFIILTVTAYFQKSLYFTHSLMKSDKTEGDVVKNHKTVLRASEAEKIRLVLQKTIIDLKINRSIIVSERWDDPSDWYTDTYRINKLDKKIKELTAAIDLVGGLELEKVNEAIREY